MTDRTPKRPDRPAFAKTGKPQGRKPDGKAGGKPWDKKGAKPGGKPSGKPPAKPGRKPIAKETAAAPATAPRPDSARIAKVIARAGVASRRDAEAMIEAGRVTVNGEKITSPALNVGPRDRIVVDGKALADADPARVWLYHKPTGLVTTNRDEKGRDTVFDHFPADLPRVMTVGRLDLTSEGLLLLTNDGELKRRLEMPSTGWLRRYRVRVNGRPSESQLAPLRDGITVDGERFQPMQVAIDRQQGANAWLTIGLREGKNREIRRAAEAVGLFVNRLIRVSYGPFQLGELKETEVEEIKPRVLRDQLGEALAQGIVLAEAPLPRAPADPDKAVFKDPRGRRNDRPQRKEFNKRDDEAERPRGDARTDVQKRRAEDRAAEKLEKKERVEASRKRSMSDPSKSIRTGVYKRARATAKPKRNRND